MSVGARTHRFTLKQPAGPGSSGHTAVGDPVWGALQLSARATEAIRASGVVATAAWQIEIAYRADVRSEWQVVEVMSGRTFQIHGYADPDDRQRDLWLFTSEVQ